MTFHPQNCSFGMPFLNNRYQTWSFD